MGHLIEAMERACMGQYCRLLRMLLKYNSATYAIASVSGNTRYLRELSQEREQLQAQLDRLQIRVSAH